MTRRAVFATRAFPFLMIVLVLAFSPAEIVTAATKNWIAGSGNWNTGGNWSPAGVPGAGDDVNIKPTDGVSRTVTYDYPGPPVALNSLGVNLNNGVGSATTTFSMSANNLTTGELDVGWSGSGGSFGKGTFTQSGGVTTLNGTGLYLGVNATDTGTYNLSGSGTLAASFEVVGSSGTGIFNQTGGSNATTGAGNNLVLGYFAGSTGTYTISGGTLSVGSDLFVGNSGTGTLNIQGNGSASTNVLSINSASAVNLNGGTLRFNTVGGTGGLSRLNYTAGKIQLAGNRNLSTDTTITTLYGASTTIPAGKELAVEFQASLNQNFADVTVSGGRLTSFDYIGGAVLPGAMEITGGGIATTAADATLGLTGGTVGVTNVRDPGSTWTVGGDLYVGKSGGGDGVLTIENQALVYVTDELSITNNSRIELQGGTLRFNRFVTGTSKLNYYSGTVQYSGNRSVGASVEISLLFGDAPVLGVGKGLSVEGSATLARTVTLDGGTFTAGQLVNGSLLDLKRGTFNLTNQAVTIGSGGPLGSTLDVNEDVTVNVTLGITNQGLVSGDGQIGGTFANAAAGELRAEPGRSLKLTGANNTNAGQISLYGGMLEFTQNLTNNSGALISGNGTLKTTTGLTNNGTMNFSGLANVVGDVTNSPTGKIISSGGGPTTFLDDVTNNGEIRTSAGSFTVFFGSVSGAGTYTGTGTVNFEGDLKPGSSPASVSFGGNVVFGPQSSLVIEIGGMTPGSQYDRLVVSGALSLAGSLDVSLINGFLPSLGNQFTVLNFGSRSGDFASYTGLTLPGHLSLKQSFTASSLLLKARPTQDGDISLDGIVDISDVQRVAANWLTTNVNGDANDNGFVDISDIQFIAAHWLQSSGGGSGLASVPEPSTLVLALLGLVAVACGARRAAGAS
ncbi:MAG: PEP-CTERM sorting domain-containing protein [Planctomycetia bacterium]|nr:PEP-CTERM sorting domain-containing protein [Planctomycetia bacterium]